MLLLRDGELKARLKERERTLDTVQSQVSALTRLLGRTNALKDSAEHRAVVLEAELTELRDRFAQTIARAVNAR